MNPAEMVLLPTRGDEVCNAERWAVVPRLPGYEASTAGRIRRLPRIVNRVDGHQRMLPGKVLKSSRHSAGYFVVGIGKKNEYVHALVLEAFVGPRPDGYLTCHNNGNPADNRLSNLRWGTPTDNAHDTIRHGRNTQLSKTHCPEGHPLVAPNLDRSQERIGRRSCRACALARGHRDRREAAGESVDFRKVADAYHADILANPTSHRRGPSGCGTRSGYKWHARNGEKACAECLRARRDDRARQKRERAA